MPSSDSHPLVRLQAGQTVMRARRVGADEVVVEDLLALDPGDPIRVEGEEYEVAESHMDPDAPGPGGPVPQTRIRIRPPASATPPPPPAGDRPAPAGDGFSG